MAKVLASFVDYPPRARIGSFNAVHQYLAVLAAAGHDVEVLTAQRVRPYELDGVKVEHISGTYNHKVRKCDIGISHLGDDRSLHKICITDGKPSVRFIHGTHDARLHDLLKGGEPTLVVYNSHSMAEHVGFQGDSIVCHPILNINEYRTTPGKNVTLINLFEAKGGKVFDQVARYLPDRPFLGVRGGYGKQVDIHRKNVEVIAPTVNMRDDVYARTRILLMPSEHESWGMVGVEAFCSGIPVIAHPTPGLIESLGDAGIFVDRDDIDAWVDTIEALDEPDTYMEAAGLALSRAGELANDDSPERFIAAIENLL